MQNYICLGASATNRYELFSIYHLKKNEMPLSKLSIATYGYKQKGG